jgi:Thoeris protein ThsB, TIR-like domain
VSESNPIRLFVSHLYAPDEAYYRVFEYLESATNFFYRNCSTPDAPPRNMERETLKEDLRRQISEAEIVVIVSDLCARDPVLIEFQALFAKASEKPVIVMEPFGTGKPVSKELRGLADAVIGWNSRDMSDNIRRQARHEDTTRWDVIDFKPD